MDNQENNQNDNQEVEDVIVDEEEKEKKKKARILVVIEVILLLLVIVLAIIFFSSKGSFSLNIFNGSSDGQDVTNSPKSGDLQVNENITNNIDNNSNMPISGGNSVSVPINGNSQKAESVRLSLPVPDQSPVSTESAIPEGAIKISGLESGFSPSEFTVSPGEEITLALTSKIKYPVILTFYEETMPATSIGCGPFETRWVTFTAPNTSGRYTFKNDVFGKSDQVGVMIVE